MKFKIQVQIKSKKLTKYSFSSLQKSGAHGTQRVLTNDYRRSAMTLNVAILD